VLPLDAGEHGEARLNRPAGDSGSQCWRRCHRARIAASIASNVRPIWLDWLWKMLPGIV